MNPSLQFLLKDFILPERCWVLKIYWARWNPVSAPYSRSSILGARRGAHCAAVMVDDVIVTSWRHYMTYAVIRHVTYDVVTWRHVPSCHVRCHHRRHHLHHRRTMGLLGAHYILLPYEAGQTGPSDGGTRSKSLDSVSVWKSHNCHWL